MEATTVAGAFLAKVVACIGSLQSTYSETEVYLEDPII